MDRYAAHRASDHRHGIAGAALARAQGLQTLHQLKLKMSQGVFPGDQLLDGALILAGGLLLLTPGLITDAVGFLALVPGSRRLVRAALVHAVRHRLAGSRGPRPR